jgi:hypothetical protein
VPSSSSSNIATSDQTEGESVEFTPPTNPDQPLLLSAGDDVKTKLLQWEHLAHLLMDPHRYLIYHLKNHYATIFGLREITAEDGTVKRQILCARKAQLPKHWIDWTEVHKNISTSRTYCIMGFRRLVPPPVQEEASIE